MRLAEIKMSPSRLKSNVAMLPNALVGLEFELIVKDVNRSNDGLEYDYDSIEADFDRDEHVSDYSWDALSNDIKHFFIGEYNSRSTVGTALKNAAQNFLRWRENVWDDYVKANFRDWEKINVDELNDLPDINDRLDKFKDEMYNDFCDNDGSITNWLEDKSLTKMSNWSDEYGLDWPCYTEPEPHANSEFKNIRDSFAATVGIPVTFYKDYHQHGDNRPASSDYIMEPDSSLEPANSSDYGLEFVSPPMSVDKMIEQIYKVKKWAIEDSNAYTNSTCGLHMNVSFPGYKLSNLDYIKLAIFLGDDWVSKKFGRFGNIYAKSATKNIKDLAYTFDYQVPEVFNNLKSNLSTLATKLIHDGDTDKYMSINTKKNRVEFRSPGGNWLEGDINLVIDTLRRAVVALDAALNPDKYQMEYAKKLYKLISKHQNDSIALFTLYQSKSITMSQLKQKWAELALDYDRGTEPNKKTRNLASKIIQSRY